MILIEWLKSFFKKSQGKSKNHKDRFVGLSSILPDTKATIALHKFLLTGSGEPKTAEIEVETIKGPQRYLVGIVDINIAPLIPAEHKEKE
jgi:hypothetical protein